MINNTFKRLKKESDIHDMRERVLRIKEDRGKINERVNKRLT